MKKRNPSIIVSVKNMIFSPGLKTIEHENNERLKEIIASVGVHKIRGGGVCMVIAGKGIYVCR
jgi:hypothetical protein